MSQWVGAQQASDRLHCRMDIDAFNNVVAIEKRAPGEDEQIRQSGIDKRVILRLGTAHFSEEGAEAPDSAGVEAA